MISLWIILQWIAALLLLYGLYLIGRRNIWGWYSCLIAEVLWVGWAVSQRTWGLATMSAVLVLVYVYGIAKWKNEGP